MLEIIIEMLILITFIKTIIELHKLNIKYFELKEAALNYLEEPSVDGTIKRHQLRKELQELIKE